MNLRRWLVLAGALCALCPSTAAASTALPAVTHTLSTAQTTGVTCASAPATGRGLSSASYTAPMSGYLNIRLTGSGDWDLVMRNGAGRAEHASQGFGGTELVQTWIAAGEKVVAEGCRHAGAASTAALSFELLDVKPPTDTAAALVRVYVGADGREALDNSNLDATESRTDKWVDVIVNGDKEMRQLRNFGAKLKVLETDLGGLDNQTLRADSRSARSARLSDLPSGRDTYRTYEDIQAELKQLAADHPDIARPVILGKTYQGREIAGLEFAKNVKADDDGRPTFFVMGTHHAREWPAAEIAMEFANLMAKSSADPRIAKLLKRERVTVVPLVNVDGYISSRSSPSAADTIYNSPIGSPTGDGTPETGEAVAPPGGVGAYRRKNCNNEDGNASTPCESAHGVDNNRNYGNLWGGPGASADLTSQSYHGQAPRSEPETQAVFNYVRTHHVTTLITLHTIAALVLRPPGIHDAGLAPDEKAMKKLGDAMAAATGYTSEYGWQLYDTAGTTEDDTYAATGGYGYTIEIGPAGGLFHGPYDVNVIQQWTGDGDKAKGGMHEALLEAAETAAAKSSHARVIGTAPAGKVLRLRKKFDTLTSKYCLQGVDPAVSTPATAATKCTDPVKDPITLHDSVDFSTHVKPNGTFRWDINQSTRPFINGGATVQESKDVDPPIASFNGAPGPPTGDVDHEFTLPANIGQDKVRVDLTIAAAEDYDLAVFRKEANGDLTPVGTSGNAPGENESVTIQQPTAGATYVARVNYYAAATGNYTLTATRIQVTSKLTKGHKEAYTLTCEDTGGKVLESYQFVIDRGQTVTLHLGCGQGRSTDGAGHTLNPSTDCALPNTAPTIGCKPIPTGAKKGRRFKLDLRKDTKSRRALIATALAKGYIPVRTRINGAGKVKITAKLNKKVIARKTVRFKRKGVKHVKLKVTHANATLMSKGGKLSLTAVATGKGGRKGKIKRGYTLRRRP
jgi:hypothetical protein